MPILLRDCHHGGTPLCRFFLLSLRLRRTEPFSLVPSLLSIAWAQKCAWLLIHSSCGCELSFAMQLSKFAFTLLSLGLNFRLEKVFSEFTLISVPVSILKSTSEPCIDSETVHAFLSPVTCLVSPRKCVEMAPSCVGLTSFTSRVRRTTAKCPLLLHLLHSAFFAGQSCFPWLLPHHLHSYVSEPLNLAERHC